MQKPWSFKILVFGKHFFHKQLLMKLRKTITLASTEKNRKVISSASVSSGNVGESASTANFLKQNT